MKELVTDVRKLRRLQQSPPPIHKVPVSAPPPAAEPAMSSTDRIIAGMTEKNPALAGLIEQLGLVPLGHAHSEDFLKYRPVAEKLLETERMYTRQEIVDLLLIKTKGDVDRAERGFVLMTNAGAIKATLNPALFYLGTSTPF